MMLLALLLAGSTPAADLAAARAQRAGAEARAIALDAAAAASTSRADAIAAQVAALAARVQASEAAVAQARAQAIIVERQRRRLALRIADARAPLAGLIAVQARIARRPLASTLIEQRSIADAAHVRALLAAMTPQIQTRTAALRSDVAAAERLRREAARLVTETLTGQRDLARHRTALAQAERRERAAAMAAAAGAEDQRTTALATALQVDTLEALVRRTDQEAGINARLASLPAPLPRPARPDEAQSSAPPPVTSGEPPYRLPVIGRVLAGSGEGGGDSHRTRGLTIATSPGAQVIAPAAGRVAFAGPFGRYGEIVILDHGRGLTSLIVGLSPATATTGQVLLGGSPIGRAGDSLQIELRRDGQPIDVARMAQMRG